MKHRIFQLAGGLRHGGSMHTHKPLFFQWLFSYISVLLLPILICSFYYAYTYQELKSSSASNQRLLLENARETLDYVLYDSITLANNLILNKYVTSLSYNNVPSDSNAVLERHYLSEELNSYKSANTLLEDILLYFPQAGYLVTSASTHPAALLDDMENQPVSSDMLAFLYERLPEANTHCFSSIDERSLLLARPLIMGGDNHPLSIAIMRINKQQLIARLENHLLPDSACMFALISQEQLLLSTQETEEAALLPVSRIWSHFQQAPGNTFYWKSDAGATYAIDFYASRIPNVGLISVMEKGAYHSSLYRLLTILCGTLILCILLGLLITYYYSRKNYSPLAQIIRFISKDSETAEAEDANEYRLIMKMLSQNRNEIERQRSLLRNNYLLKILDGEIPFSQISAQISSQFSLSFPSPSSCVIQLSISRDGNAVSGTNAAGDDGNSLELLSFIIQNILSELLTPAFPRHYFCARHNLIFALINLDAQDSESELLLPRIRSILEELHHFLSSNYGLHFLAGISSIQANEHIPSAALQAANAVEYLSLFGQDAIKCYDEIPTKPEIVTVHLNSQDYIQNLLLSGSREQLDAYFQTLLAEISEHALSAADIKSCFYFFYLSTEKVRRTCQSHYDLTPSTLNFPEDSYLSLSLPEALEQIWQSYAAFMEEFSQYGRQQRDGWGTDICHYLENNYFDMNLNLNTVAEYFSLTPSYLSKRFKEKFGKGINEYLYEVRLTHARQLLRDTSLKVADVAEMTGFSDSNAFIRIFKKYVGTTPGKFQASCNPPDAPGHVKG